MGDTCGRGQTFDALIVGWKPGKLRRMLAFSPWFTTSWNWTELFLAANFQDLLCAGMPTTSLLITLLKGKLLHKNQSHPSRTFLLIHLCLFQLSSHLQFLDWCLVSPFHFLQQTRTKIQKKLLDVLKRDKGGESAYPPNDGYNSVGMLLHRDQLK